MKENRWGVLDYIGGPLLSKIWASWRHVRVGARVGEYLMICHAIFFTLEAWIMKSCKDKVQLKYLIKTTH